MDSGTSDAEFERNAASPTSSKGGWESSDLAERLSIPDDFERRIQFLRSIVARMTRQLSRRSKDICCDDMIYSQRQQQQQQQHPHGEKHQTDHASKPVQTPEENPDVDQELSPAQIGMLLKSLVFVFLLFIAGIIATLATLLGLALLVEYITETFTGPDNDPEPAETQAPTKDELGDPPHGYVAVMDELDFDEARTRKLLESLEKWDRVNYLLVNEDLGSVIVSFTSKIVWLRATQQHQSWASREPLRLNGETIRMIPFGSYRPRSH